MATQENIDVLKPKAAAGTGAVVRACDLGYANGAYRSFEHVDLTVDAGTVHALAGSGGAARDLLLACAGLVRPSSGALEVAGVDVRRAPRSVRRVARCGYVPGVSEPDGGSTVSEACAYEFALLGVRASDLDVLKHLGAWRLATFADERVELLPEPALVRLGASLAAAGGPRLAVVPEADTFGSLEDVRLLVSCMRAASAVSGTAFLYAAAEPRAALMADAVTPLTIDDAEALDRARLAQDAAAATGPHYRDQQGGER